MNLRVVMNSAPQASSMIGNAAGSGTAEVETTTAPFVEVDGISFNAESTSETPDKVIGLVPAPIAWKSKIARLPAPDAPEIGPMSVSAVRVADPPVLSIVPEM